MQLQPNNIQDIHSTIYNLLYTLYPELKFWGFMGAVVFAMFRYGKRVIDWAEDVKDNHLTHIQNSLADVSNTLIQQPKIFNAIMEKQSELIVDELKELRQDIRSIK